VGIVGLGGMGLAITRKLRADGQRVLGYRRTAAALGEFVDAGGDVADSIADLACRTSTVLLCLGTGRSLREVLDALLPVLNPGSIVVEMGTLHLADKEAARREVEAAGSTLLDAPVSGTPAMVANGSATVLVSGHDEAVDRVKPLLRSIGRIRLLGGFGNGTRMKYVANALVATHTVAAAEAVALAESLGLDTDLVVETISAGPANSAVFELRAGRMAARELTPAKGTVDGMRGDARLIRDEADSAGASLPTLSAASAVFEAAAQAGKGDLDVCSVIDIIRPSP